MIRVQQHGDVTAYELTGWRNRTMQLTVSVFAVRGVLVDSGFPHAAADLRAILDRIRLRGAFITHRHEDHAGNAELLAARGVPLALAAATSAALRAPRPIGFYRRYTWGTPRPLVSTPATFAPNDLELRATPGHSDDHHAVWDAETGTLFSADLFLGVKVRVAHASEDPRALVASLRSAIAWGPDRMFDGHRGLVPQPRQALSAKADWLEETIARVDALTDAGRSVDEIVAQVAPGFDLMGAISRGDYSRRNFIESIQRSRGPSAG